MIVTMGCGDTCPVYPGKRYLDRDLDDPAGLPVDQVRPIVDEIDRRVQDCWTNSSRLPGDHDHRSLNAGKKPARRFARAVFGHLCAIRPHPAATGTLIPVVAS